MQNPHLFEHRSSRSHASNPSALGPNQHTHAIEHSRPAPIEYILQALCAPPCARYVFLMRPNHHARAHRFALKPSTFTAQTAHAAVNRSERHLRKILRMCTLVSRSPDAFASLRNLILPAPCCPCCPLAPCLPPSSCFPPARASCPYPFYTGSVGQIYE